MQALRNKSFISLLYVKDDITEFPAAPQAMASSWAAAYLEGCISDDFHICPKMTLYWGRKRRSDRPASDPVEELALYVGEEAGGSDPGKQQRHDRLGKVRNLNIWLFSHESPSSS
jgi:hypothetical protein